MSIADALSEPQRNTRKPCSFGTLLAKLDEADRVAVERAVREPAYPVPQILAALAKDGHFSSDSVVYRHRHETCSCVHS